MQESEDPWRRRQVPDNEVPGCVAFEAVLASNADMVVFVSGLTVFRHGIEFTVEIRLRPGRERGENEGRLVGDLHSPDSGGNSLLLGVEFADGRRCSNAWSRRHTMRSPLAEDQPQLWPGGGGGSSRSASASWFLSPLPPPEGFRIVCAWPARNLPETITEVAGAPVQEAALRVRELWPWQPEVHEQEPTPPVLPPDGWFAQHAGGG